MDFVLQFVLLVDNKSDRNNAERPSTFPTNTRINKQTTLSEIIVFASVEVIFVDY